MLRATDLLAQDHHDVHDRLVRLATGAGDDPAARRALRDEILEELRIHTALEEELLYPVLSRRDARVADGVRAHAEIRALMDEVAGIDPDAPHFTARVNDLRQAVLAHVVEEEGGIFREARQLGDRTLERLGRALEARRAALTRGEGRKLAA